MKLTLAALPRERIQHSLLIVLHDVTNHTEFQPCISFQWF